MVQYVTHGLKACKVRPSARCANEYFDPTAVFRFTKMVARPDGLFAAAPRILRFAPDRRRVLRGSVQAVEAPPCRTGFLSVGGSN
jgi:hypothetical protein